MNRSPKDSIRLSQVVPELENSALAGLLHDSEGTVIITEEAVAEALFVLVRQRGDGDVEPFVDTIAQLHPLFAWTTVFDVFGRVVGDRSRGEAILFDEDAWSRLLRAWQRAALQLERVQKLAGSQHAEEFLSKPLPPVEDLLPRDRRMFPLTVIPPRPDYRLLTSLVTFILAHDKHHGSTLIPQTLLKAPPSTTLLELAHSLFYTHGPAVFDQHQIDLMSFLGRRLSAPKEGPVFLVKIGGFLHEKLTALMNIYLAASQGRDVSQSIDGKTTLILDASKTMVYFNALFGYADAMQRDSTGTPFCEPRILAHFERLRMMAVEIYREEAQKAGLDHRSFTTYMPAPPPQPKPSPQAPQPPNQATQDPQAPVNHSQNLQAQEDYYFGCFYRREMSASQLVELLESLAACPSHTPEAELLARMLRTLFTECRHFPKYPPAELHRTADFFGKLIRSEILLKRPELQRLAIRCVMEAVRKDVSTNIFRFGLVALQQFIDIAPCSPAFLASLTKIQGLREYFPSLVLWAEKCLALMPPQMRTLSLVDVSTLIQSVAPNQLPPAQGVLQIPPAFQLVQAGAQYAAGQVAPPQTQAPGGGRNPQQTTFGNVAPPDGKRTDHEHHVKLQGFGLGQVENLMEDPQVTSQIVLPPDAVRNRIAQIFNSIVIANVQQKATELAAVLQPDWLPWLAYYIVKTRASKEPNHHDLYSQLAEHLGSPKIIDMLTNVTYDCINILLKYVGSAREATSYRTVLKSLGSWLGLLTLARDRPLKSKSFDVKHLIYDAYERGTLIAVVPLACALLGQIKRSRIFKLPNPWTLSCLLCLGCLYTMPNLKQTICFEIELLCQHLTLELDSFTHQQPNLFQSLEPPLDSPDFQPPRPAQNIAADVPTAQSQNPPPAAQRVQVQPQPPAQQAQAAGVKAARQPQGGGGPTTNVTSWPPATDQKLLGQPASQLLNALRNTVVISRSLALFEKNSELRIAVPIAIERAVRDLVGVISERAVILAVGTTVELVLKDFCLETEEVLVKRAAQLMAASLGGSIVMVTGRSPLRLAIVQNLKELIKVEDAGGEDFLDQTIQVVAADNLAIASMLIEQVVVDQAVQGVQDALGPHLAARRSDKPGILKADPNFAEPNSRWPAALPPPLKISPFLDARQLQVYRDFAQLGPLRRMQEAPSIRVKEETVPAAPEDMKHPLSPLPAPPPYLSPQKALGTEASFAAIDFAVAALKEGVKELVFAPLATGNGEPIIPEGTLEVAVKLPDTANSALRTLAALTSNHDIFTQIERVVRLVQFSEDQESVAHSTARRLLRSIYDAANRAVQQPNDVDVDVSAIYLEAFVSLLKRFDDLQLVHKLPEVVSIWLVSSSYRSTAGGSESLDFTKFAPAVASHALLVLTTAAKYGLIDVTIIDNDFVGFLLNQALEHSGRSTQRTPALAAAVHTTVQFAAQVLFVLAVDLCVVKDPMNQLKTTIQALEDFQTRTESDGTLREAGALEVGTSLAKGLKAERATLQEAVAFVLRKVKDGKKNSEGVGRCLTIQDLLKFKAAHGDRPGRQVVTALNRPAADATVSINVGEPGALLAAMESGKLLPGPGMEVVFGQCIDMLCREQARGA